jgi:hypothetical protein
VTGQLGVAQEVVLVQWLLDEEQVEGVKLGEVAGCSARRSSWRASRPAGLVMLEERGGRRRIG